MMVNELIGRNKEMSIKEIYDESFAPYGKVITNYDFSDLLNYLEKETGIPEEGNIYKASVPELEGFPIKEKLENGFYGEMTIQIGYCNGLNSKLNGLEYHIGSEINVAATDLVLMLGKLQCIVNDQYRSGDVEAFFIDKGTAVQLYETTLHFSPCKTGPEGFKCIVILPRGTNEPLKMDKAAYGDKFLFARNKWLLAHPERELLIKRGAWPGITGENIELKI